MPLGMIQRAGAGLMGYGMRSGASQVAAGAGKAGFLSRGIGGLGRFMNRNPQASLYGGMMGIGAGIGAFSDRDSVVGNALQWGAMGAGLRYGGAGVRGTGAAGRFMRRGGVARNPNNMYERIRDMAVGAGMSIGYAGRSDFRRAMALGNRAKSQIGNTSRRAINRIRGIQ